MLESSIQNRGGVQTQFIGKPHLREDTLRKVRGEVRYVSDLKFTNALYVKFLLSPHPHALIKSMNTEEALKMNGVVDILTPFNVPTNLFGRTFSPVPWKVPQDRMILDRTVRFVGDPVAAVAAESEATASDALEKIDVEYEKLEAVTSAESALETNSVLVHDEIQLGDRRIKMTDNVGYRDTIELGNRDLGYANTVKFYEDTYKTQILYNAPIEPHSMWCVPRADGGLDIWCTTQSIHGTRYWLARALQLPLNRVNIHASSLGGGFGAKYNMAIHEPAVALLALRNKRPVKFTGTRYEDFMTAGRRPVTMRIKIGVGREHTIEVMEMKAILQSGAYADHMVEAVTCMGGWFVSSYRSTYKYYEGIGVYTNLPVYSAMRGFLNPQQNFAVESLMDEIAEDNGLDPIEFRIRNIPRVGDIYYAQGPTVTTDIQSIELEQAIHSSARTIGWSSGRTTWVENHKIYALGMAIGHHTSGTGGKMAEDQDRLEGTGAIIKLNEDGTVTLTTGIVEMGPGEHDTLATICAETIGVNPRDVRVNPGDTDVAPFDMGTHASRGTYVGGLGVVQAASEIRRQIVREASHILDVDPNEILIENGVVHSKSNPGLSIRVSEVALASKTRRGKLIMAESGFRPDSAPSSWAAVFALVSIDTETGTIDVERLVGGFDIGTVVNPPEAEGQAMGGLATGLGYALLEEVLVESSGAYANPNFMDYSLPLSTDMPKMDIVFAKSYEPRGPFGARSIGELSTNPVASAIANAISRGVAFRFKQLPIKGESVLSVIHSGHT